jgi:hypothetical protein
MTAQVQALFGKSGLWSLCRQFSGDPVTLIGQLYGRIQHDLKEYPEGKKVVFLFVGNVWKTVYNICHLSRRELSKAKGNCRQKKRKEFGTHSFLSARG